MIGRKVPDFTAEATGGPFTLSEYRGSPVVLYFYPKDNTPGCTTEGANFRDLHDRFAKAGAVVAGISRDSIRSHQNFAEKLGPWSAWELKHQQSSGLRCASSLDSVNKPLRRTK